MSTNLCINLSTSHTVLKKASVYAEVLGVQYLGDLIREEFISVRSRQKSEKISGVDSLKGLKSSY